MDLSYTPEQDMLRDSALRFVREAYPFDARRAAAATEPGYRGGIWQQFADLGWLGATLPEDFGGTSGGAVETMILMEAFGRGLVLEPYLWSVVMGGGLILRAGTAAQKSEILPALAAGECRLAFAFVEPGSRYDLAHVELATEPRDGGFVLTGRKSLVYHAASADRIIVSARLTVALGEANGIGLFLVSDGAEGLSRRDYKTQDDGRASDLTFEGVAVPAEARMVPDGDALAQIELAVDTGIAAICAEAVGAMGALREITLEYLRTREQFGRPIGTFQVLQHRMVDLFMAEEEARSMAILAALSLDRPVAERKRAVSAAKVAAGRAGRLIGQEAVQLHGGMGMTDELSVGHYFKRLTLIGSMFGDASHHLKEFAALGGGPANRAAEGGD